MQWKYSTTRAILKLESNTGTASHLIAGFLLYCLHPFCLPLHQHSSCALQISTAVRLNKLLRPMIWTRKNSTVNGKFWTGRCFSPWGLCLSQPAKQMERGDYVNCSALPRDADRNLHLHISPICSLFHSFVSENPPIFQLIRSPTTIKSFGVWNCVCPAWGGSSEDTLHW